VHLFMWLVKDIHATEESAGPSAGGDHRLSSLPGISGHGSSRKKKREQSMAMMASLMGGLILSRMTDDDAKLSKDILDAVEVLVKSVIHT